MREGHVRRRADMGGEGYLTREHHCTPGGCFHNAISTTCTKIFVGVSGVIPAQYRPAGSEVAP